MPSQRERRALGAQLLQACEYGARVGGAYIRSRASDLASLDWQVKSPTDFVSEVDTGAEERIAAALAARVPGARILGEELSPMESVGDSVGDDVTFIVDPLDGTTNFLHGYPVYAVSIAALAGGQLLAGAILDVPRDALFTAAIGGGAARDGQPIRVSTIADPARALVGTGFPFKHPEQIPAYLPQFARVIGQAAGVRRAGAAALDLADVACGRFDAFWELMLAPWDVAAGILLVREAGGVVTDLEGRDALPVHGPLVAGNPTLHAWLIGQLATPPHA